MEALFNRLQIEVRSELEVINPYGSPVKGYDQKMKVVQLAIMELRHHLAVHGFTDKTTEIKYFKHWLPFFCTQYIYFTLLYKQECIRITSDGETLSSYLENEKKRISAFLTEHRELYLYYTLNKSDKDELLFVRTPLPETGEFIIREENFCQASFTLSELLAYEKYKNTLDKETAIAMEMKTENSFSKLKWTGTKTEAVELIVLFHESKLFDHTLDQLKEWFEKSTGVDLKNLAIIDNNNRNRKKSASLLLDKLNQAVKNRMDRLDP